MTKYEVAAQVALQDADGFDGKLSANEQRNIFGKNIFGRKWLRIDASGQGRVIVQWAVAGLDSLYKEVTFEEIANDVNGTRRIIFG